MKREILIQSYPIKCFTKYLLMMAIRDLDNIKKNNLYLIKQITDNKYFIYSYMIDVSNLETSIPIKTLTKDELNNILVNINSVILIKDITHKILKDVKSYSFSFINENIFKNTLQMCLQKKENICCKPHSLDFRDEINKYRETDNLFVVEQITKLYYYVLTNIYLIFKDISVEILEEFLDSILDILKEMEKICLKNKYFYPFMENTEESKLLNDFRLYTEKLYKYLLSYQEKTNNEKSILNKNERKDYFLNLTLNSKIQKKLTIEKRTYIRENEEDLLKLLQYKKEFLKDISN